MALNSEERYQQELYEEKRKQDQTEIDRLNERLDQQQSTINHLNNHIDKLTEQRDQINGAINLYNTGERSVGVTLDTIRGVMR